MGIFDFDPEKLNQESQDASNKKDWLNIANSTTNNILSAPSAAEMLLGQKRAPVNVGLDKVAAGIQDPWEKQKKTYEAYKAAKEGQALEAETDPNSRDAMALRGLLVSKQGMNPEDLNDLTKKQMIELYGNPGKLAEIKAQAQVNFENDMAKQKASQQFQASENAKDRTSKQAEKTEKEKELSAVQAKQMGLYNLGIKAEEQYNKAIANKKDYDPTLSGQVFDNDTTGFVPNMFKNNKAIEAKAAEANWIEAFLRDASGAAIPPSERGAYAKDFFPQPGDTPQVVANKALMRKQKMDNALLGAGKMGNEILASQPTIQPQTTVRIKDPRTGRIKMIPRDQAQAATAAGGILVDQIAGQ